jgi:hypothetical protein
LIRLSIVVLHTVAAAIAATAGGLAMLQGLTNLLWEHSFYATTTDTSWVTGLGGLGLTSAALADVLLVVTWFAGSTRGAWVLVVTSLWIATALPFWTGLVLQTSVLLVLLDVMVMRHRSRT